VSAGLWVTFRLISRRANKSPKNRGIPNNLLIVLRATRQRLLDRNRERASNTTGVGGLLFIPSINLEPEWTPLQRCGPPSPRDSSSSYCSLTPWPVDSGRLLLGRLVSNHRKTCSPMTYSIEERIADCFSVPFRNQAAELWLTKLVRNPSRNRRHAEVNSYKPTL